MVPAALRAYENVRRQRAAGVQRRARLSGANYDAEAEAAAVADAADLAATR